MGLFINIEINILLIKLFPKKKENIYNIIINVKVVFKLLLRTLRVHKKMK